jgi:hypothetical protein
MLDRVGAAWTTETATGEAVTVRRSVVAPYEAQFEHKQRKHGVITVSKTNAGRKATGFCANFRKGHAELTNVCFFAIRERLTRSRMRRCTQSKQGRGSEREFAVRLSQEVGLLLAPKAS